METRDNGVEIFHAIYNDDLAALAGGVKKYGLEIIISNEETPLIYAVMMEKIRLVHWLLDQGANMYAKTIYGDTGFHLAAMKGYFEMVKYFCIHGMDLNATGEDSYTALNYAVSFNHDDVAEYLIIQGASLDIPDDLFNETPLDRIRNKNKIGLLKLVEARSRHSAS